MSFMDKLERKFGRYAIPELQKYFVYASAIGLFLGMFGIGGQILDFLRFDMNAILRGQIWRLVTWVVDFNGGGLFSLLFLFCLVPMGRTLESFLGTFRMNVYLIGGVLLNILGGIVVYLVTWIAFGVGFPIYLSTYYIMLSIFMALAIIMPDATVNLYFILPIKMKWMLLVYLLELGYEVYSYFSMHWVFGIQYGSQIILALVNLFSFFWLCKIRLSRQQRKRQREFRAKMNSEPRPGSQITRHKCAICGRTEKDDPNLTFRYCSKCSGNKEYCNDHLFTHTHIC